MLHLGSLSHVFVDFVTRIGLPLLQRRIPTSPASPASLNPLPHRCGLSSGLFQDLPSTACWSSKAVDPRVNALLPVFEDQLHLFVYPFSESSTILDAVPGRQKKPSQFGQISA
jgi:hypothetical protein